MRKKWLVLSPEEWVRQHLINFLKVYKGVPSSLISVEKEINLNGTRKRYDVVVYNSLMQPVLLVECKSPDVALTSATAEQALRYNLILGVKYLLLSNGISDMAIKVENNTPVLLSELPEFTALI
ncbi:MAG: type I restriction enzyme HsdR N-terminal domain-containing protein [Bacteroidia bacterium]